MNDNQQHVDHQFGGNPGTHYTPFPMPNYYPSYQRQLPNQVPMGNQPTNLQGMLPMQQSYIENILRLNRGKMATVYMTFEGSNGGNTKIFRGIIEAAGRDHLILSDPETDRRYLLLMVYLDYVTFDEEINYSYPFQVPDQLATYEPR